MRSPQTVVALSACSLLLAAPALAQAGSTGVEVSTVKGERTLSLRSLTGDPLGPTSTIRTGPGQTGSFLTAVTDARYKHVGYQVTATMTDLRHETESAVIPSSAVSLSVPPNPLDLSGVSTLVEPVFTLTGDLTGALTAIVPLPLGSLTSVTSTVSGLPQAVGEDATNVLDGTLASLPVRVDKGQGGTFQTPAKVSEAGVVDETGATTLRVMSGAKQDVAPSTLVARLQKTLGDSSTVELVNAGVLDASAVTNAVANTLGIAVTLLDQAEVLAALEPTLTTVREVLGQSGVYTSNQALGVAVPSTAPTGTYRGVLTVTLADVP